MGNRKLNYILHELEAHAPFAFFGALLGVVFMVVFSKVLSSSASYRLFYIFHPAHVLLSAVVSAAMYIRHVKKAGFLAILLIGYVGSVGIATLSDSVIPYVGEVTLGLHDFSPHAHGSTEPDDSHTQNEQLLTDTPHVDHVHESNWGLHLGFIEEWYIVNPAALIGIIIAYFWPRTKFPHAGHVLLSIWASLFHIMMALTGHITLWVYAGIALFLFVAVWLPCCISDIVFPLLFVKESDVLPKHEH
ncbi:MAG: hypothetical protein JXD22_00525 [Sedimentisphaerales bacterium]|nr:hypothetical protein [Sedimentisphaerales bacterium]